MPDRDEPIAAEAAAEQTADDLGQILKNARAARGLSLEAVAAELRMEPRMLEALEANRLADLGPPVFAKGYLKQYGNRLGLNYNDLLSEYYKLADPHNVVEIAPSRVIKIRDDRQIAVWVLAGLAVVVVVALLFIWWVGQPDGGGFFGTAPSASPAVPAAPSDREAVPRAEGAAPASLAADSLSGRAGADAVSASLDPPAAAAANVVVAESVAASESVATAESLAAPDVAPTAGDSNPVPAAAADVAGMTVAIAFTEDCWVEMTAADGEQLLYGLRRAGERSSVSTARSVKVFLGNADGAALTVDGVPFPVPRAGRQGNLARFTIDAPID